MVVQLGWSVEGMRRIQRHAAKLLPRYFELMAANFAVAGPAILDQVRTFWRVAHTHTFNIYQTLNFHTELSQDERLNTCFAARMAGHILSDPLMHLNLVAPLC